MSILLSGRLSGALTEPIGGLLPCLLACLDRVRVWGSDELLCWLADTCRAFSHLSCLLDRHLSVRMTTTFHNHLIC